jgi:hypothetical protein
MSLALKLSFPASSVQHLASSFLLCCSIVSNVACIACCMSFAALRPVLPVSLAACRSLHCVLCRHCILHCLCRLLRVVRCIASCISIASCTTCVAYCITSCIRHYVSLALKLNFLASSILLCCMSKTSGSSPGWNLTPNLPNFLCLSCIFCGVVGMKGRQFANSATHIHLISPY